MGKVSSDTIQRLNEAYLTYHTKEFIAEDPICLPHQFTKRQDIEIIGFWVAMLAWGQRKTIIQKGQILIDLMDGAPYDFVRTHKESDRKRFLSFVHRTFNATDALFFIDRLQFIYTNYRSMEEIFLQKLSPNDPTIESSLTHFHTFFFDVSYAPDRTRKHIASPAKKSTCKRLNMFLRWMVRPDEKGVDFGLWHNISPSQLCIPLDVHVERTARRLGLLHRKTRDWKAVLELTLQLKQVDEADPVKYDYALFGLSRYETNDR